MNKILHLKRSNTEDIRNFAEALSKNKKFNRFLQMLEEGAYAIDTDALIQEIEDLHLTRKFRGFRTEEFIKSAQNKLAAWTSEVDRNRSRCVTIKVNVIQVQQELEQQIKDMRSYLLTYYRQELNKEYNTVNDKKAAVDNKLEPFNKLLRKLNIVIKICDIILEDLKQSHFSKQGMIEIMTMNYNQTGR